MLQDVKMLVDLFIFETKLLRHTATQLSFRTKG